MKAGSDQMCNRYISMTGEEGIEKDPKEKTLTAGLRGAFQVLGTALAEARRKEGALPCLASQALSHRMVGAEHACSLLPRATTCQPGGLYQFQPSSITSRLLIIMKILEMGSRHLKMQEQDRWGLQHVVM